MSGCSGQGGRHDGGRDRGLPARHGALPVAGAPLARAASALSRMRRAHLGGMTVGVTVGCLLGMVPCLWLEPHSRAQPCPA